MQGKNPHSKYQNIQISTVDRGRLLLMLYDGCIKFLRHAKAGLEAKDYVKFARFLSKSQAIIVELMNTLDFEKGGNIAKDLDRLYDFMMFYLTEANLERNPAKIEKVIELVSVIAGAFREIIETGKAAGIADLPPNAVAEQVKKMSQPTPAKEDAEDPASPRVKPLSVSY